MSQVPNSHLLLVKDFVFLVVCEHIVFYQLVVDDGGEFVQQPDAEAELVRADRNQIRVSEVPDQNVEKLSGLKN